ncbi:hypothetical protein Taro_002122 [Colocasia esculenta]|uniref:Uncharacterized protein n=1 Tax=Colocasia esculenta TaxID=4460 RepID=A0A843TFI6_COLES|nr:hypothetical protein [Colocasia esculenta]
MFLSVAHLPQRHARSKKLLEEGRLKLMLNSDGEIEEEEETHAERHARTVALLQAEAFVICYSQRRKIKGGSDRAREGKWCLMNIELPSGGSLASNVTCMATWGSIFNLFPLDLTLLVGFTFV